MKKLTGFLILLTCLLFTSVTVKSSYAVTSPTVMLSKSASPSANPSQNPELINKIDQQINNLKEKIASRVAQLNLVEKRGFIGTVMTTSGTEIKLTDIQNNIRFVDVDEITKFYSSGKGTFGISDLKKSMVIGVLGNYNKESKRILARFVDVVTIPQTISANIDSVDKKNFQFNVTSLDQKSKLIDVGNVTKTFTYSKDTGLKKAGFSKITPDERVYVVGFPDISTPDKIIASRIILLPELTPSNANATVTPSSTPSAKIKR